MLDVAILRNVVAKMTEVGWRGGGCLISDSGVHIRTSDLL